MKRAVFVFELNLDYTVAVGLFGSKGIVIDIKRTPSGTMFFDCNYWSDFQNEDERFFIGGLVLFNFVTIRDVKHSKDFQKYIKPLTMLDMMIQGFPYSSEKLKKEDRAYLKLMIDQEIQQTLERGLITEIPDYCLKLWHNFLCKVEDIIINIFWMGIIETEYKVTSIQYTGKMYGYDIFRPIFFIYDDEEILMTNFDIEGTLNLKIFCQMFTNLKTITIFNAPGGTYNDSIKLDELMVNEIFNTFEIINESKSLSLSFQEIRIVQPLGSNVDGFIQENKEMFHQNGLGLDKIRYKNVRKVSCDETLSIRRLS